MFKITPPQGGLIMEAKYPAYLINIDRLRLHEDVDESHLINLISHIMRDGKLKRPIVADKNTYIVLDGAHRLVALKRLGCRLIPTIFLDYESPDILVYSWRDNSKLDKKDVIRAGYGLIKYPPKSTKHMIKIGSKLHHISIIQNRVDIPLEVLKFGIEYTRIDFKD